MTQRGALVRAIVPGVLLVTLASGPVAAQVVDYPAQYFRGRGGVSEPIDGRLIVADTALFFTQRNGRPIFAFPYDQMDNAYAAQALYGPREDRPDSHYLVVVAGPQGRAETVVFRATPFVPDTVALAITARLDARRQARYSSTPAQQPQIAAASSGPAAAALPGSPAVPVVVMNGRPEGWKDGGTATILSLLIPGAGQMYAGETGTGILMLLGSSVALGVAISSYNSCSYSCDNGGAYAGLGIALAIDLVSLIDAAPAASRHNKRLLKRQAVGALIVPTPDGLRLGLSLR